MDDKRTHPEFLPLDVVAATLNVPRGWLRDQAKAGIIPCIRAGKRRLFDVDSVRRTLIEQAALHMAPVPSPGEGSPQ